MHGTFPAAARICFVFVFVSLASLAHAQAPGVSTRPDATVGAERPRELLNSERIEGTFGSYWIQVLESGGGIRVSNLYSEEGEGRICRTFAVVRYPASVDPALASEHAAIVAGGSIGATFAQSGWTVVKVHRFFGEIDATARLEQLMGGMQAPRLAVHVYAFDIVRGGERFEYAMIAEVHHPEYLRLANVREIYGGGLTLDAPDEGTVRLLDVVAQKSR
jgi:hypothetical protein